ncbi:MAG: endonuclease/exonuclease/phosphatase family protein [Nocardioides sp.]
MVGAATALAAALTLSLTAAPSTSAATERGTSTITLVSYNAGAKVSVARSMWDLEEIIRRVDPDIISLQEMSNGEKRQQIRKTYLCDTCEWDAYMPGNYPEYVDGDAVKAGTPLLYRSDRLELEAAGTEQVTERTYVGDAGAGPRWIQPKYVNWVRLRDQRSQRLVHVFNNHTVPSVQGRNGGPNRSMTERLGIYRKHMTGLQELIRGLTADGPLGLSFVTGDLNVNYRRDKVLQPALFPYRRLGNVGMRANWSALGEPRIGTHTLDNGNGTRLIDYVYFTPQRSLTPSRQRILRGMYSDHRPVSVSFEVKNRWLTTEEPATP